MGATLSFGELIREHRLEKRLTLGEVARLIGETIPHMSDMEHGRRVPATSVAKKLCEILGGNAKEFESAVLRSRNSLRFEMSEQSATGREVLVALARGSVSESKLIRMKELLESEE